MACFCIVLPLCVCAGIISGFEISHLSGVWFSVVMKCPYDITRLMLDARKLSL